MTAAEIRARNADIRARNVGASDRSALSATAALNVQPLPLAGVSSIKNTRAPVAQLDRALPSEGKGRTFESSRARQLSRLFALCRHVPYSTLMFAV